MLAARQLHVLPILANGKGRRLVVIFDWWNAVFEEEETTFVLALRRVLKNLPYSSTMTAVIVAVSASFLVILTGCCFRGAYRPCVLRERRIRGQFARARTAAIS